MHDVARWRKARRLFVDQVQSFLPTPMSAATTMYYTGLDPNKPLEGQKPIYSAKSRAERQRQKGILRYHDPPH